jgi:hypothetical protein
VDLDALFPHGFTAGFGGKGYLNHGFMALNQDEQLELLLEDAVRPCTSTTNPSLDAHNSNSPGLSWDIEVSGHNSATPAKMGLPTGSLVRQLIDMYLADINTAASYVLGGD